MNPVLAVLALSFLFFCVPAHGAAFRVGQGAVRITPGAGVPLAGYYSVRLAEGAHDELFAKALVLEAGGEKAALVVCDLIGLADSVVAEARRQTAAATDIAPGRIMISATHSHTGPLLTPRFLAVAPPEARRAAEDYLRQLPARISEAVKAANAALTPARVSAAAGKVENLSFNRRFFMTGGTVGWNPGKLNPRIVKPAGPVDPRVPVLYFESEKGAPLATYVNFSMHLDTVGGLRYSADYPYTLARLLGEVKGPGMLTMFSTGPCGNINHIDVGWRDPQKGHGEAARIGTILAAEVLKTYRRLKPADAGGVRAASEVVPLPLAPMTPEDLTHARLVASRLTEKPAPPFLEQVKALRVLDVAERQGRPIPAEVQVIALGREVAWVGLPGEIFVEISQDIQARSPFPLTIVVELANGAYGYFPNRAAFPQGAYEVVSTRAAEGSGEMMAEAALRLLDRLKTP